MNLLEVTLRDEGDALVVQLGTVALPVAPEVVAARPTLRGYAGRAVVLGIRPEDMEDASLVSDAPAERRITALVELSESLGSDVVVHFSVDAPQALTDDVKELAVDVGQEALEHVEQQAQHGRAVVLARLNPRTRARKGESIELVIDTQRLHFFDLDTGAGIY
jgi:multiple sugar transport system ATP-binding protein